MGRIALLLLLLTPILVPRKPALDRSACDAPVATRRFPSVQLATIHHELHRPHGQAQHPRYIPSAAVVRQGVQQTIFHCEILSLSKKIKMIQLVNQIITTHAI